MVGGDPHQTVVMVMASGDDCSRQLSSAQSDLPCGSASRRWCCASHADAAHVVHSADGADGPGSLVLSAVQLGASAKRRVNAAAADGHASSSSTD